MVKIVVIGSGSALCRKGRFNTSLAILEGARTVLLDCAEPCAELLYHHGIDSASVDTVVLSHMHADHVTGLGQVAHMKYLLMTTGRRFNRQKSWYKDSLRHPPRNQWDSLDRFLTIYVPAGVEHNIRQYLRELFIRPEIITEFDLRIVPYGKGLVHKDRTISITAYANSHIWSYYPELDGTDAVRDSYSLLVEVGSKKFLYSSDLGALSDIEGIAERVDLLFLEGAHPSPENILAFVKRLSLKRVIIVHISADREEAFGKLKADMARVNVELSYDGLEVEL